MEKERDPGFLDRGSLPFAQNGQVTMGESFVRHFFSSIDCGSAEKNTSWIDLPS